MSPNRFFLTGFIVLVVTWSAVPTFADDDAQWIQLFNGKNLDGWSPKIVGQDAGDNWQDTFRVEAGVLKVSYDKYEEFGNRFGHIFYTREAFSRYRLRVEYRFVGEQVSGGPGWALRNSGIMVHGQPIESMGKNQKFPVSIEVQLLGGTGEGERPTANLCTPGTHVVMDGKLLKRHCTKSSSKTYHGEQWVTVELMVDGDRRIEHLIDGVVVLSYDKPQLDPASQDAAKLADGKAALLSEGYISLQSESHPIEFRKVELLRIKD